MSKPIPHSIQNRFLYLLAKSHVGQLPESELKQFSKTTQIGKLLL